MSRFAVLSSDRGQLDPPVHDVTFFDQGGQLDLPVCDVTFFSQGGQLDPPVHDVTFFGSKEVSWIPLSVT